MELAKRIRLVLIAGVFSLTIAQSASSDSAASTAVSTPPASVNTAALDTLEKRFFMQTFSDEKVQHRLDRLEQRVFGKTMSGTAEQRLSHLQETAGAGPDTIFGAPAPSLTPASAPATTTNLPPAPKPVNAPKTTGDIGKENERLRVQEAAEQQINALLAEGVTAWRQHNADLALDRFKQVVRLDPLNSQAFFSLGIIYETQGDYQKAVDNYEAADKLRPNSKDYTEALVQARKKLAAQQQTDSRHAELSQLSQQALAAYNRGEYLSALDLYKQIDEKFPDQAINKYNIGSVYRVMRQPETALPYYKKARELDPKNEKISQAYDSLQAALKEQAKARQTPAPTSNGYAGAPGAYPAPAGPSKHSRRPRPAEKERAAAGGYIKNYGLETRSSSRGLKVKSVVPGTRAAAAGVQSGDTIKAINGSVVDTTADADRILSGCNPMRQLQLTIQRNKRMLQVVL